MLSWKAVRKGPVYCAPACGRGCTHVEYRFACAAAAKAVKLLGKQWKPRVHENLGWHAGARCKKGHIGVSIDFYGKRKKRASYRAYLNLEKNGVGGQFVSESYSDPRRAVEEVKNMLVNAIGAKQQVLMAIVSV